MKLTAPSTPQLIDQDAEVVRREHEQKIVELQKRPFIGADVLENVVLRDGVPTPVSHGLGRPIRWVKESCVRGGSGNGRVEEVRDGSVDRNRYVLLVAIGYGAPITVSLLVMP